MTAQSGKLPLPIKSATSNGPPSPGKVTRVRRARLAGAE